MPRPEDEWLTLIHAGVLTLLRDAIEEGPWVLVAKAAVVGHPLICNGLHYLNLQSASSWQSCVPDNAPRGDLCSLNEATVKELVHNSAQAGTGVGQLFRIG